MLEVKGNIFDMVFTKIGDTIDTSVDALCITTNGIVNDRGLAMMGAGTAGYIANRYPLIRQALGNAINTAGNVPAIIGYIDPLTHYHLPDYQIEEGQKACAIWSFPTKTDFRLKSDLALIKQSALHIKKAADARGYKKVLIPYPGIGIQTGQLAKADVRAIIKDILDDRFQVISLD